MSKITASASIENRQLSKSMQTLIGICTGISADNHINDSEIHFLNTWLNEYESVINSWPGSVIAERVRYILSDGIISEDDRENLLETLQQITGNYFTQTGSAQSEIIGLPFDTPQISFSNTVFCFTGQFITGTRKYCCDITEKLGASPSNTVSKKVDYLVIGTIGSPEWLHVSFGNKIAQSVKLKQGGHPIAIITERHWIDSIKANRPISDNPE